ncbi:hypothetical protein M5689_005878 [Euphorbia peplus]|nr:hypothetical protein M5689_005878 [Euphorbia peplus]
MVVSPFDATNTSMETLIPSVELKIQKHEEADVDARAEAEASLLHIPEIAQLLTETSTTASKNEFKRVNIKSSIIYFWILRYRK